MYLNASFYFSCVVVVLLLVTLAFSIFEAVKYVRTKTVSNLSLNEGNAGEVPDVKLSHKEQKANMKMAIIWGFIGLVSLGLAIYIGSYDWYIIQNFVLNH